MTSILDRPAPPPDVTVSYGPLPEHVIDLRLPARTPGPLIVMVHGGFWRPRWDRAHLGPFAQALAGLGYVVAVPEYRRAGMAAEGWKGTFNDIAAIFDQVTDLAAANGADVADVTWAGHSAGGHLVLWAAARPYFPVGSPWRGDCDATRVVSLAGCGSLRLCAEWNLDDGAAQNLLGGSPAEVPDRYALTDPAALTPPTVPVIHVHGTNDDRVPLAMSQAFPVGHLIEIPGANHFDLIDPDSPAWPTITAALKSPELVARLRCLAANVRVNAHVVEWAGQERRTYRAGPTAVHVIREIAALRGGYTPDDQPDGENCRSEMHLDLRQHRSPSATKRTRGRCRFPFQKSGR